MNNHYALNLLCGLPLAVLLVACGTPNGANDRGGSVPADNTQYAVTEDYDLGVISYTVQRGDRLGDIAQEFTGRSSNWRAIAKFNNILNPRSLQAGTVLDIPTDLIADYERPKPVQTGKLEQTPSLALRRDTPVDATVVVTPVNTNRDFKLNPIEPNASTPTQNQIDPNVPVPTQSFNGTSKKIKVVGSYYPIGIYTQPVAYSKLIMRASPGSIFVLDSQVNDWYKIETTTGSGYIRTSDAAILK